MQSLRSLLGSGPVAAIAALFLLTGAASERSVVVADITGEYLADMCAGTTIDAATFCTGYILGTADQLGFQGRVCRKRGAVNNQVLAAVRQYLERHSEIKEAHASVSIERALKEAYPCP